MAPKSKSLPSPPALDDKSLEALMEEYTSRLEEKVAYESRFFRLMADAMPQIVWTALPDGRPDYFNQRWYEYTGATEAESLKNGWVSLIHPDEVKEKTALWHDCIKSGGLFEAEARLKDIETGGYRWFLIRARTGVDDQGKTIKWFGTCTDIDDQKRTQANKDVTSIRML